MKRLFAVEKFIEGAWKPVALHKLDDLRMFLYNNQTLVCLPTCRVRRIRSCTESDHIMNTHSLTMVGGPDPIEWTN